MNLGVLVNLARRLAAPAFAALVAAAVVASPVRAQDPGFSSAEKPFATISRMLMKPAQRDSLVDLARSQVGLKYKLGAKAPGKAFDCSGLVQWLLGNFDLSIPRTSREQAKQGVAIAKDPAQLLPGDLLFFGRGTRVTHVGIYVGDGKYVQAANRRAGVVETPLPTGRAVRTWWKGVRRIFEHDTSGSSAPKLPDDLLRSLVIIS
jgi:cell wall-associated NlpC family hydrolase